MSKVEEAEEEDEANMDDGKSQIYQQGDTLT